MARVTTDELVGYAMTIVQGEEAVVDNGMPVFNGTGEPKTQRVWGFVFVAVQPDGTEHRVLGPHFAEAERAKIVQALTGGVEVAHRIPGGGIVL